jgi:hypothetical protein
MNGDLCFIEQTLFMIFLWIGIWGLIDVVLDHQNQTYESRIKIYIFFIFVIRVIVLFLLRFVFSLRNVLIDFFFIFY